MKRFSERNWLDALAKLGIALVMINSLIIIIWFSMDWSVISFYESAQNLLAIGTVSVILYILILYQVKKVFGKKRK